MPTTRTFFALAAAAMCLASGLTACTTNPTTGRRIYDVGGHDKEVAMGAQAAPQMTQEFGGEMQNPALRSYITEVGMKLKDQTGVDDSKAKEMVPGPQRTWVYTLLDSDVINAFALPGERVFITRGLADNLTSEAQLAGVLGHETGHVMAQHMSERMGQALGAQILSGAAAVAAGIAIKDDTGKAAIPALVAAGGQIVVLKFSREQEAEADSLGMRYMTKAGYNPHGQLEVMQVLDKASGGSNPPEWLATHPLPKTRIDTVGKELQTTYAYTQSGDQARNYQDFADRYKQRYLDIRAKEPKPAPKAAPKPQKKQGALPVDHNGRERLLAATPTAVATDEAINLDEPATWCAVCAARLADERPGR